MRHNKTQSSTYSHSKISCQEPAARGRDGILNYRVSSAPRTHVGSIEDPWGQGTEKMFRINMTGHNDHDSQEIRFLPYFSYVHNRSKAEALPGSDAVICTQPK